MVTIFNVKAASLPFLVEYNTHSCYNSFFMDEKNIHILSGSDAARRLRGHDDVMRRFVQELPLTSIIIRDLLEKDPADTGAQERVISKRCKETCGKVEQNLAS